MADLIITEKANITAIADKVRALDNSSASLNFEEMKDKLTSERQNVDGALAALAEKGVEVPEGSTAAALPELIGNIQIGSPVVEKKDISFYDYDGTLLYSYTVEEANMLTALPAGPTHEGLVFDGWNWSLEDVKSLTRPMNIGAMYATDDGTTRIYIHLEEGRTSPMLGLGVNGTVTVDWGDGTNADTLTGTDLDVAQWTSTHSYATPGDYVIRLTVNGEAQLYGNRHPYILSHNSSNDDRNNVYQSSLLKAEIGTGIHIGDYAFYFCRSLSSITIPNTITSIGKYAFTSCFSLLDITIPNNIINIIENTFETCYSLSNITMPNTITNIGKYAFMMCSCLSNITIPNSVTSIGDYAFYQCYSLSSIIISNNVISIGEYAFR